MLAVRHARKSVMRVIRTIVSKVLTSGFMKMEKLTYNIVHLQVTPGQDTHTHIQRERDRGREGERERGGKDLLYLQQVGEGNMLVILLFKQYESLFSASPVSLFPFVAYLLSPFCISLRDVTKWPTRNGGSLNENSTGIHPYTHPCIHPSYRIFMLLPSFLQLILMSPFILY